MPIMDAESITCAANTARNRRKPPRVGEAGLAGSCKPNESCIDMPGAGALAFASARSTPISLDLRDSTSLSISFLRANSASRE